jgi:UPF0755 protein
MKTRRILLLLFAGICIILAYGGWVVFGPAVHNPERKFLYITTGSNYGQVRETLMKESFLNGSFWLDKISSYADYPRNVKAGKYRVPDGMSLYHLVRMLRAGRQVPVNLVITKLRTKEDLARKIAANFESDSATAIHFLNNADSLRPFDVDTSTVMTDVIPDTYTFTWNTPVKNIFRRLSYQEQKFWNGERVIRARRLGLTPKQVYTLASIVEEETNKTADKGKIASVYINRLRKGMKLGADPTIKYAMRDFGLTRIYHKYLQFESPYNTYRFPGLPPGPICTPSVKTLDAVLDAPGTDYLYFVARADFSGYSDFASTFRQHQANARAYQQALDSLIRSKQSGQ